VIVTNIKNPLSVRPVNYDKIYIRILDQGTNRILAIHRTPTPIIESGDIIDF